MVSKELNDLFPTWFKKYEVIFSGLLPTSNDEKQQVLVIPYPMFEVALDKLVETERLKANINLLELLNIAEALDDTDYEHWDSQLKSELKSLRGVEQQLNDAGRE